MHAIIAYRLRDRWLISPESKTTAGLRLQCGPFLSLPRDTPTSVLGEAVLSLFAGDERLVPHPVDWKAHALPRLLAAGVKTESTFQRGAAMVSVTATTDGYCFEPTMNGGATGSMKGFHSLPNLSSTVSSTSNAEILGSVLSEVMARCIN